jgi:hypothetical protein
MEFHEAANFLLELRRFPSRAGTDATRALLSELGDPRTIALCPGRRVQREGLDRPDGRADAP